MPDPAAVYVQRYRMKHPLYGRYQKLRLDYRRAGIPFPVEWSGIGLFEDWCKSIRLGRNDRLQGVDGKPPHPRAYILDQTAENARREGNYIVRNGQYFYNTRKVVRL